MVTIQLIVPGELRTGIYFGLNKMLEYQKHLLLD
jgi:hypothetical protein